MEKCVLERTSQLEDEGFVDDRLDREVSPKLRSCTCNAHIIRKLGSLSGVCGEETCPGYRSTRYLRRRLPDSSIIERSP